MDATNSNGSPLDPAFKRLEDAHRQWHQAQDAYFEPEDFRLAMQACIQTLRTVTFVLQNNKRALKDFEGWYEGRQAKMRADSVLKWLIEARNHIEKQGDLETYSELKVKVVASYYDELEVVTVEATLFDDIDKLLSKVPPCYFLGQIVEHGALRIERRWVANSLPSHELLDAIAHSYTAISSVLKEACIHWSILPPNIKQLHPDGPSGETSDGRLMCMQHRGETLEGIFSLKSGQFIEVKTREVKFNSEDLTNARSRFEKMQKPQGPGKNLHENAMILFSQARQMMETDGHHITLVVLLKENKFVKLMPLEYENRTDKYLLMRQVAEVVAQTGADSVVHIAEAWTAFHHEIPHMKYASDVPTRWESLVLLASSREESFDVRAEVSRVGGDVKLGKTVINNDGVNVMFTPILKVWAEQDAKKTS